MEKRSIRLLLLEDNPTDAVLLQEMFTEEPLVSFIFTWVEQLSEGLERLKAESFDVILVDLGLPDSQGLETFIKIREHAPYIPIVMLTGLDDEALAERALQEGAQDYLVKGQVTSHILARTIRYAIERKRLEETLRESNRRLEEALTTLQKTMQQNIQRERLHALGQMASGIAHDFNNVLGSILGFSELLLAHPNILYEQEKARYYLELINTGAKDAAAIVRRLREFYRSRTEEETFLPVDVNSLIEHAILLTQPRWKDQALARGCTFHFETDLQNIPLILGNETELREVLINLIFNAIDAMPGGGTIRLCTFVEDHQLVLTIGDTGIGMSEQVRTHCLEPFFSTKGAQGTGLGLAMVHGVIRRHEGTITIESEEGTGTTVIIRLPISTTQQVIDEKQPITSTLRPLYVLVVEDEPLMQNVLTGYLANDGHRVETASNGREGLGKFLAGRFDLVITDRAMPEMNGEQLAVAIKKIAPNKPVLLLTGFGDTISAEEKPSGVDYVVGKPVTLSTFREILGKVQKDFQLR